MIPTDEIIKMAHECHVPVDWRVKNLVRFAALVSARAAAIEREACAKVCDTESERILSKQTDDCFDPVNINLRMIACVIPDVAKTIRARGDQHEQ